MQAISEVMQEATATKLTWASDKCNQHEKYPEGVQMLIVEGEVKCPLCERARLNTELEIHYSAQKNEQERLMKYNKLSKRSILQDKTLLKARFSTYEVVNEPEAAQNARNMLQYADEILAGEVFNIFLNGRPGVGKSHLSYSLLNRVNENCNKEKSCLFVDIDEMLRLILDAKFDSPDSIYTEIYFTRLLSEVDVLVLDDLGAETGNEHTTKQASDFTGKILRAISNARQDKVTIVTTNLSGDQLNKMYDHKTLSRLSKNRRVVKFEQTKDKRIPDLGF